MNCMHFSKKRKNLSTLLAFSPTINYRKNMPNIYELVTKHGDVAHAIEFAKKRRREFEECFGADSKRSDWDPCTTVDLLVSELNAYLR